MSILNRGFIVLIIEQTNLQGLNLSLAKLVDFELPPAALHESNKEILLYPKD